MPYKDPEDRKRYQTQYDRNRRNSHRSVKVTLTKKQYQRFESLAYSEKTSVSRLLVALAESGVGSIPYVDHATKDKLVEVVRLLRSSSNSINEIAHACNIGLYRNEDGVRLLSQINTGLEQLEVIVRRSLS